MILVYTHTITPRLQYITHFLFRELMGLDNMLVIDSEYFKNYDGPKINYSDLVFDFDTYIIRNHTLLFEEGISEQQLDVFEINNREAFFKTTGGDHPFDIFAAAFYLLTRYEEYGDHEKDEYGRYAHTNSTAFKSGFLDKPIINLWVKDLAAALQKKFPALQPNWPAFKFLPTYDIDIAYAYKYKGVARNIGGFVRSPSLNRLQVLAGAKKDPFDTYKWLEELHKQNQLSPLYFFLVAEKNGRYDKNILPHKDIMWKLVKYHARRYDIGLHPSWQSGDKPELLEREKEYLADMGEVPVNRSRQHYIRFNLPADFRRLVRLGIKSEYSMGYGSINGFRASVAAPFYWYDLEREEQTFLRVHPFCFMDANAYYEEKLTAGAALEESLYYLNSCREANGTMISVWHNNFLGTDPAFKGWRDAYEKFIAAVRS